jgi:branched-chain amino acid transport system substrate-binding protein
MKKAIWYLITIVLLTAFLAVGCSQSTTTAPPASSTTAIQPTPTPQGIIKIGHIRPLTGNMASTSDRMIKAFDFAFEKIGYQVAGKKIQIIIGDSKGDAATAIDVARKMVENDKVDFIVGPTQGGEEMATAGYTNQVGIPEIFTNPEPLGVIMQKMKWCIGSGGTEPQIAGAPAAYAYDQLGYRKVDILAPDTAPGHGFLNAFMDTFKKKGGQIVQETYTPYPSPDFASYLTVLKDADALVAWMDGDQSIKFLSQYHEMGIDKRLPLIAAFHGSFLAPFILNALPPADGDAMVGRLTPTPYTPLLNTAFNTQWVADFKAKFGVLPEDTDSGPYQGAMAIIEALKATNGDTTPDKFRQAMLAVNFQGPEGPVKFDAQTGASIKTIYIAKVVKQNGNFTWEVVFTYPDVSPMGF